MTPEPIIRITRAPGLPSVADRQYEYRARAEITATPVPGTNNVEIRVPRAQAMYCASDIHGLRKEERLASRLGWFRAPHWTQSRRERAAYCNECAAMLISIGVFDPDE